MAEKVVGWHDDQRCVPFTLRGTPPGAAMIRRERRVTGLRFRYIVAGERGAVEYVTLADIVTLYTPLNADTHHLLNRRRIEQMKRGAYIINTGCGPLLDTEALVSALESGRLGGAALDVLEGEEGIFYADCRSKPIESKRCCGCKSCLEALRRP
jgi:lactate dehydrogenase-like 2-hydroxyacid dehydrogenase